MKKLKKQYPIGDFGIWLVIYLELITFGGLFVSYAFARREDIKKHRTSIAIKKASFWLLVLLFILVAYFL